MGDGDAPHGTRPTPRPWSGTHMATRRLADSRFLPGGRRLAILVAAVAIVAAGAIVFAVVRCSVVSVTNGSKAKTIAAEVGDGHAFDWTRLDRSGTGRSYSDAEYESTWGVDVSEYKSYVDWARVKASGVQFAMIRVGYRGYVTGNINVDDYFEANIKGATEQGIDVGFYFFSQAISTDEAKEEADYVVGKIKGYATSYPIVYDMESIETGASRIDSLDIGQRTAIARAFCEEVKAKGYYPMVYGNTSWFTGMVSLPELEGYPLWLADYEGVPDLDHEIQMWQFSVEGEVDGIDGETDLDMCLLKK